MRPGDPPEAPAHHFIAGEPGNEVDLIRWANKYKIYQESKADLEQMVDLVEAYVLPVMAG